jgi:hypothetical protein
MNCIGKLPSVYFGMSKVPLAMVYIMQVGCTLDLVRLH